MQDLHDRIDRKRDELDVKAAEHDAEAAEDDALDSASWAVWQAELAFLTIISVTEHDRPPSPAGLIPLTRNQIAHLTTILASQHGHDLALRLRWSAWGRRHQYRARACHYRRQAASDS